MTRTHRVRLARMAAVSAGLWLALESVVLVGPGRAAAASFPARASGAHRTGSTGHDPLSLTGFPFVQVGIVAAVLIGLGVAVTWAGGRRPEG